jgi:hypothetical protein
MKNAIFAVVLVLAGCGGESFTASSLDPVTTDADPTTDGGADAVSTSTGGRPDSDVDSGSSAGGASAGGAPTSTGGSSGSTGGVVGAGGHGSGGSSSGGSPATGGVTGTGGTTTECAPGATRCPSAASLQTCDASGSWATATACVGLSNGNYSQCCGISAIGDKPTCGVHPTGLCGMQ